MSSASPSWGDTDAVVSIHSRTSSHAQPNDPHSTHDAEAADSRAHDGELTEEPQEEHDEEEDAQQEEQQIDEEEHDDDTQQAISPQTSNTRAQARPTDLPAAAASTHTTPRRQSKPRTAQRSANSGPSSGYGTSYTPQRVVQPPSAAALAAAKRIQRSPYTALHPPVRSAASASAARGLPSLSSLWLLPTRVSVAERTTTAQQAKLTAKSHKADPSWKGEIPPNQTQMFDLRLSHPTILSGPLGQGPAPPLPLPGAKNTFEGTPRGAPRSSSIKRQENGAASAALTPVVEEPRPTIRRPKLTTAQRLAQEAERENEALWAQSSAEEKEQLLAEQRRTVMDLRTKTRSARKVREEAWRAQEIPLRRAENALLRGPEARLSQYELWWSREDAAKEKWMRDNPGLPLPDDFGRQTTAGDTQPLPSEEQFSEAKLNEDEDADPVEVRGRSRGRNRSRSRSPSKRRGRSLAAAAPFGSVSSGRPVDSTAWLGHGTVGVEFKLVDADDPEANAPLWPEYPELAMPQQQQHQSVQHAPEQLQAHSASAQQLKEADNTPMASSAAAASVAAASAPVPSHRSTASLTDPQGQSTSAVVAAPASVDDDSGSFSFADMDDEDDSLFPEESAQPPPQQPHSQPQHPTVTHESKQVEPAHAQHSAQVAPQQHSFAAHSPSHSQSAHPQHANAAHSNQASLDTFDRQSSTSSDAPAAVIVTPSNAGHMRNSSATSQHNGAQHGRNGSSSSSGIAVAAAPVSATAAPYASASSADSTNANGFASIPSDEAEPSRHSTSHSGGGGGAVVANGGSGASSGPAFSAESDHADEVTEFPDDDGSSRLHNHNEEPFTAGTTHTGTPREASRRVSAGPVTSSMHARNQSFEEDKPINGPLAAAAAATAVQQTNQPRSQQQMQETQQQATQQQSPVQQQLKQASPAFNPQTAPAPLDVSSPVAAATRTPAAAATAAPAAAPAAAAATTPSMSPVAIASPTVAAASAPALAPVSSVPGTPAEWKADESRLASGIEATKLPRKTGLFAPKAKQVNLILSRNTLGDSWLLHWGSKSKSKEEQQLNLSKSLKAFTRGADKGAFKANKEWNKKYTEQSASVSHINASL